MGTPLLSLLGLAAMPPQAISRFTAARQEYPSDQERKRQPRQRRDEAPRSDPAHGEQIGAHIDTTA